MRVNCRNGVSSSVNIWKVGQGPVGPVREQLFHHGMVAVLGLGLEHLERRVCEEGVVAPDGEQVVLAFAGFAVKVADGGRSAGR